MRAGRKALITPAASGRKTRMERGKAAISRPT
jgi:hypothetical protein